MSNIILFDVDGTLAKSMQSVEQNMVDKLKSLKCIDNLDIGIVGGSNLEKQKKQLGKHLELFDYIFSENGLVAFKNDKLFHKNSISKELGEDNIKKAGIRNVDSLYGNVRKIHFKMYFHYLYFNAVKWSYLQGMVIVPYLALAPTIVTGAITLGFVQQIARAFNKVENSLQYLVRSWPIIVELISVQRRLSEFESKLERATFEQEKI